MLFVLIVIVFIIACSFKDNVQEELEKDKKDWERLMNRKYE